MHGELGVTDAWLRVVTAAARSYPDRRAGATANDRRRPRARDRRCALPLAALNLKPSLWASLVPRDPRERKPNHYAEMARVAWRNRDELPFAWRLLTQGVCDGCALGTAGLRDWTLDGIHLCMVRLELLRLNTAGALDPGRLADVSALEGLSSRELRELGRLPEPMIRRKGEN